MIFNPIHLAPRLVAAVFLWSLTVSVCVQAAEPSAGKPGVRENVAQIMARARQQDAAPPKERRFILRHHGKPGASETIEFPIYISTNGSGGSPSVSTRVGQPGPFGTNGTPLAFTGATLSDTGSYPPDTMGAVGPSQFIVAVNGRIRTFNKTTGLADGVLNSSMDAFFNSVMTPPVNNNFTSDPRIRYDRLSGRWFVMIIDVPGQTGVLPNRVLIAVSDASVITAGTVWSFYQFQHDLVSPAGDTGEFADYPTLGIDANALYLGVNVFTSGGAFDNTTAFVVQKSSLLSGGPIGVTAFRRLISGFTGPYTPQGVDNFDPAATEGYIIGIDYGNSSRLRLRRVSNPGGTPTMSGNVQISVSSFASPITVPSLGALTNLDGLDERLLAAHYRNGSLWTSHNVGVNSAGGTTSVTRNGVRWYKLGGIPTGQTPSVQQSGTIYDSSSTNKYYWMGSIMVSGQGHAVAGFSSSSSSQYVNASVAGRLASDASGTFGLPINYTASSSAYNPPYDRWGDYSYTSLDPNDDMTVWTIQEFVNGVNSYAVQIGKIAAPPPAFPTNASPTSVTQGVANVTVTVQGSSTNGSGFFDPGSGFSNRLTAAVSGGGITLNSVTYNNPTNLSLNLTIASNAVLGARSFTVTNPDGQISISTSGLLTVVPPGQPPVITVPPVTQTSQCGSNATFTVTATGSSPLIYQWSTNGLPVAGATNTTVVFTNVHLPGFTVAVVATNSFGSATSSVPLTVQDTLGPVITLIGAAVMTNELGSAFTNPGATANDLCAGSVLVISNGTVNVSVVGTNTLTYTATDGNGNASTNTRTVLIRDTTPPVITFSFTNLIMAANSNCVALMTNVTGTNFILASDLSGALTLTQTPTNNATLPLGTNLVVITVADASANKSFSTNRIVVRDQTPPSIALVGGALLTNELGAVFTDPGVTFSDLCSGILTVTTNGAVNSSSSSTNTLTYTATDGSGNTNAVTRTVLVRDTTPPVISWSFTNLVLAANSNCVALMTNVTGTNFILATDLSGALTLTQTPTNNATLPLGTNLVVITVADASANKSFSTNRIVVRDQTPPSIALVGGSLLTNELGAVFTDPGVTFSDLCSGILTVTTNGAVNISSISTNTLTYTATDGSGNTNAVTRTVLVRDTVPPVISWSFTNLVFAANSNCIAGMPDVTGTNFILATDLSGALAITQSPTNNATLPLGTNLVVITVADTSANQAFSTNRIVVRDQTPPLLALNGNNPLTNELGAAFTDPGVTSSDACSGIVSVTTNGSVNVGVTGTNMLAYTATDTSGNTNTATRVVIVRDTTPPMISWSFTNLVLAADTNCSAAMPDVTGTNFILATDLSGALTISQSPTNSAILPLGTNLVVITVKDASGNAAYSTNFFVVQDQTPPVITLIGGNSLVSELGQAFADPGATANDACAGVVVVAISGSVNTNAVGTNTLTYTAADGNGNTNAATRTVLVRDTTPPVISWSFTNFVLALDTNCSALMPDVTGTNFIRATDLSGPLAISQTPTNGTVLIIGTNVVVVSVSDIFSNAAVSTNTIVVQDQTPPLISSQPQSRTNFAGTTANFSAAATACTPLVFQWLFNSAILPSQTNSTLTLVSVSPTNAGNYSIVISAAGGSATSAVATLTVNLVSTTITLASSENPSGFQDAVNFTAVVTPTNLTGSIQFFTNGAAYDSETLVAGQAVSTSLASLPRGTNFITAVYSGDANDLPASNTLAQIVTNHPPVAAASFYTHTPGNNLSIAIAGLAANWSDVDGDTVSLAEVGVSTNGITLTNNGTALVYFNSNNVADLFICTITDGFGGTNFQAVNLAFSPPADPAPVIVGVVANPGGSFTLNLAGAPGYTYVLEATPDLFPALNWQPVATNVTGTNGVWQFTDTSATNFPQQFYRLKLVQ